jgi:hypothetical protein
MYRTALQSCVLGLDFAAAHQPTIWHLHAPQNRSHHRRPLPLQQTTDSWQPNRNCHLHAGCSRALRPSFPTGSYTSCHGQSPAQAHAASSCTCRAARWRTSANNKPCLAIRRLPNAAANALLVPTLPCRARFSHLRADYASLANKDFTDDLLTEGL